MDYSATSAPGVDRYYSETDSIISEGTLKRLIGRIIQRKHGIIDIGSKLREHADAVHGAFPEASSGSKPMPCRSGLLGELEDALDQLDEAAGFMAEQAGRNCTLA